MSKRVYGINKKSFLDYKPSKQIKYCYCKNCKNTWEEEFEAFMVTGATTSPQYDYCSECYKEDWPDNSTE